MTTLIDEARALKAAAAPRCSFQKLSDQHPTIYAELLDGIGQVSTGYLTRALNDRMAVADPEWRPWSINIIEVHRNARCSCGVSGP